MNDKSTFSLLFTKAKISSIFHWDSFFLFLYPLPLLSGQIVARKSLTEFLLSHCQLVNHRFVFLSYDICRSRKRDNKNKFSYKLGSRGVKAIFLAAGGFVFRETFQVCDRCFHFGKNNFETFFDSCCLLRRWWLFIDLFIFGSRKVSPGRNSDSDSAMMKRNFLRPKARACLVSSLLDCHPNWLGEKGKEIESLFDRNVLFVLSKIENAEAGKTFFFAGLGDGGKCTERKFPCPSTIIRPRQRTFPKRKE